MHRSCQHGLAGSRVPHPESPGLEGRNARAVGRIDDYNSGYDIAESVEKLTPGGIQTYYTIPASGRDPISIGRVYPME